MRYIRLTEQEEQELSLLYRSSPYLTERKRSQCLLLSHRGRSINELAGIFGVTRLTITIWLDRWEGGGLDGIRPGPEAEAGRYRAGAVGGIRETAQPESQRRGGAPKGKARSRGKQEDPAALFKNAAPTLSEGCATA